MREFRPYFDNAPVYGHGPSLEDFTEMTPLTVGSPQQVIDRYAGMRDHYGDYQRQLFLIDHAGLPLKTVLEQLDILGGEVVPVLRKELAKNRPGRGAGCPDPRRARRRRVRRRGPAAAGPEREPRRQPDRRLARTRTRRRRRVRVRRRAGARSA